MLAAAIETAYRYRIDRPLNVIVLSDEMTETGNVRELMRLIGTRPVGTRVFAIGIGNEVNRPVLRDMTVSAGGLAAFLSRNDDFDRQADIREYAFANRSLSTRCSGKLNTRSRATTQTQVSDSKVYFLGHTLQN